MTPSRTTRRAFGKQLAIAAAGLSLGRHTQSPTRLRMLLNSDYSSVNAWFTLAADRGLFREANLEIEFTTGRGAYTAAGRMVEETFDVGYGDVNALIERVAAAPSTAPIGVYMMFSRSPSVIAVPAESPVRTVRDLMDRHLIGHATDVALQTFPVLTMQADVAPSRVRITTTEAPMIDLVRRLLQADVDAMFGYESTIAAAMVANGIDRERVRFLRYRDLAPALYGSVVMISRRLASTAPSAVNALVRAINRGVAGVIADPAAALAATRQRLPKLVPAAEQVRLDLTLRGEMSHPDVQQRGLGAIDPQRLVNSIGQMSRAKSLARVPTAAEVFDAAFAIPAGERVTRLLV